MEAILLNILFLFFSFLLAVHAGAITTKQAENQGPSFKRVCYYTNWSQYRKQPARFLPFNIDPFLCTHIIFSFSKIDYNGHLAPYEWNDIQYPHLYRQFNSLKKKNPSLRTLLAVGGWTHGSKPFTDMVKTDKGRQSFIDHAVQYLRTHNFDGLDLDWEYPANRGSPGEDKKRFSQLVKELKQAFEQESKRTGKQRLLLTAAVGGGEKIVESAYEVPTISKHLDFINLMSYDLNGGWSKTLGTNAGLYAPKHVEGKTLPSDSVDGVVQLWLDLGADPSKLVMGIPLYGRSFTICSPDKIHLGDKNCGVGKPAPYTREKGFMAFYEIVEKLKQGWTRKWLDDQQVPIAYNLEQKQWIGYDDVESVKIKTEYIKKKKLAGAMMWAVDLDDFSGLHGEVYPLSRAIRSTLEGDVRFPEFRPPPRPETKKTLRKRKYRKFKKPADKKKPDTKSKPYKPSDKKTNKEITSATFKETKTLDGIVTHPSILVHTVHDSAKVIESTPATHVSKISTMKPRKSKEVTTVSDYPVTVNGTKGYSIWPKTPVINTTASTTIRPSTTSSKPETVTKRPKSITKRPAIVNNQVTTSTLKPILSTSSAPTSVITQRFPTTRRYLWQTLFTKTTATRTTPKPKSSSPTTIAYPWNIHSSSKSPSSSTKPSLSKPVDSSSTSKAGLISPTTTQRESGSTKNGYHAGRKTLSPENSTSKPSKPSTTLSVGMQKLTTTPDTVSSTTLKMENVFNRHTKKFIFPTREPRKKKSDIKFPFIHKSKINWTRKSSKITSTPPTHTPRPRTTKGEMKINHSTIQKTQKQDKTSEAPRTHMSTKKRPIIKSTTMATTRQQTTPASLDKTSKKVLPSKYEKTFKEQRGSPYSKKEYIARQNAEKFRLQNAKPGFKISSKSLKDFEKPEVDSRRIITPASTTSTPTTYTATPITSSKDTPTTATTTLTSTSKTLVEANLGVKASTIKPNPENISEQLTSSTMKGPSITPGLQITSTPSNKVLKNYNAFDVFNDLQAKFRANKKYWTTKRQELVTPSTRVTAYVRSDSITPRTTGSRSSYITLRRRKPGHIKTSYITKGPKSTTTKTPSTPVPSANEFSSSQTTKSTSGSTSKPNVTISQNTTISSSIWKPSTGTTNTTTVTIPANIITKKFEAMNVTVSTNASTTSQTSTTTSSSIINSPTSVKSKSTPAFVAASWSWLGITPRSTTTSSPKVPGLHLNIFDNKQIPVGGLKDLDFGSITNDVKTKTTNEVMGFSNPLNKYAYTELDHPVASDPRFGLLKIPRKSKNELTKPPQQIYRLMTPRQQSVESRMTEGDIIIRKGKEKVYQYVYHTTNSPVTMPWDRFDSKGVGAKLKKLQLKLRNRFAKPFKYNRQSKPQNKWDMIKSIASTQHFETATKMPYARRITTTPPIKTKMPYETALYNLNDMYQRNHLNIINRKVDVDYEVQPPQVVAKNLSQNQFIEEEADFECPTVFGIFADRKHCQRFYQCVWFVSFHHTCGQGTVWNDNMKICDWPGANSCSS